MGSLTSSFDPSTPLTAGLNTEGNPNALLLGGLPVATIPQGKKLKKYSSAQVNFYDPTITWAYTNIAGGVGVLDKTYQRYGNYTFRVTPSANTSQIRKGGLAITCDPDDLMQSVDVYIPHMLISGASGMSMSITLCNTTGWSANNTTFTFDSSYLRQGWNSLRMWFGDTNGASGTGTLAYGAGKTISGTGCDMSASIGYFELNITNMNGLPVYLDGFRRSAKANSMLVMGFDATGSSTDNVMLDYVAPLFAELGLRAYFTVTQIYDMLYANSSDDLRKHVLYDRYKWEGICHTWNHGGSKPGGTQTVTLNRSGSTVTGTGAFPSSSYTVGEKFYAAILNATPSDFNGVVEVTINSTTQFVYTQAGTAGAATGTITFSTLLQDVAPDASTLSTQIINHEIIDITNVMRTVGFSRGSTVGAWPNNSVPFLSTAQAACAAAGIKLFRGIRGGTVKVNEFGIDNPLNFGSVEMGSGTTATFTQYVIDKLNGAIARGEHMWTYGHFILNELAPANIAHVLADMGYPPGSNGNPNPPVAGAQGGIGGWWYLGQLKRFLYTAVLPAVKAGTLTVKTPSEFQATMGIM